MIFETVIFLSVSFLAAAFATLAGFGSSTLLMPAALIFMDIKPAIFLVACFHMFNNLFKVRLFYRKIDFRTFFIFGIPSVICAFFGALLISILPVQMIKKILAGFLVLFALFSLFESKIKLRAGMFNGVIGGGLSGFLAGLIGLGGAIRSAFLIAFDLPKETYVATAAMIAFVVDLTRIPAYIGTRVGGDAKIYMLLPFLLLTAFLGVRSGKILLEKMPQLIFRRIVLITIALAGLKLFF